MAEKRLLYFTAQRVTAYSWKSGHLEADGIFATNDEGVADFGAYVAKHTESLYYMLADVVEEDFLQENIPALRGKDRSSILQRKIAQRYRDSSLATAISLGITQVGGRREEGILFASFANTQPFQPWLSVLRSHDARLVGVYSSPLVAPLLARRLGFKSPNFLMVSVSPAGLRQSYVEGGHIRLSRLGHADMSDPRALAQLCAQESARMQQYLVNLRIIPRDAGALDVIMLVPAEQKALYEETCNSSIALTFHVHQIEDVAKSIGLKDYSGSAGSEALFLHTLAASQPTVQFASDELRRFYNLWRTRLAIIAVGGAAFLFCLVIALLKSGEAYFENKAVADIRMQEQNAVQRYAQLQANFPKTPTESAKLGQIVKNYQLILGRLDTPESFLIDLGNAMGEAPQIELESIEWTAGAPAADAKGGPPAEAGKDGQPAAVAVRQSAVLNGRINVQQTNDFRTITRIVDQFVASLRKQNMEVVSRRLPFEITAQSRLSGDIGTERATQVPRFTIQVIWRKAAS